MFCENCGKKLEEGSVFCNVCGAKQPQPIYCIRCGKKLEPRSLFCNGCGAAQMPPEPVEPKIPQPQPAIPEVSEPVGSPEPEEKQPEAVHGKSVEETTAEPVSEESLSVKKKNKKWLIPVIALVAAVAVAAVFLIPSLFPPVQPEMPEEMVTVYLLTGRTEWVNGEQTEQTVVVYDDQGRPTEIRVTGRHVTGRQMFTCTVAYDSHGNRIEEKTVVTDHVLNADGTPLERQYSMLNTYDFEYSENGQIEKCTAYSGSDGGSLKEGITCVFTYDKQGNLILVEYSGSKDTRSGQVWEYYEYDQSGRLIQETAYSCFTMLPAWEYPENVREHHLYRHSYSYDKNGELEEVCQSAYHILAEEMLEYDALDEIEFEERDRYSLKVSNGHLICQDKEYTLDQYGNPELEGCTFDAHGNLLREESSYVRKVHGEEVEEQVVVEYTYQTLELPKSAAQKAERWMKQCCLPDYIRSRSVLVLGATAMGYGVRPMLVHIAQGYQSIYYYLIPNPVC